MIKYYLTKDLFYEVTMKEHMNEPIEYSWTDQDVLAEYRKWEDKRKVSRIFDIPVSEINKILKRNEALQ